MARTQPKGLQIKDNTLTGSDIAYQIGLYDETYAYAAGRRCVWNSKVYEVYSGHTITPSNSGDISNNPNVNTSDWFEVEFVENTPYRKTLLNNDTGYVTVGTTANDRVVVFKFSIKRDVGSGDEYREGLMRILHDGTNTTIDYSYQDTGSDLQIELGAVISGGEIRVTYTTANIAAGSQSSMVYRLEKGQIF